jgi:hypothetical protein
VKTPKKYIIPYDKLAEFIANQKKEDETHLAVPKEVNKFSNNLKI